MFHKHTLPHSFSEQTLLNNYLSIDTTPPINLNLLPSLMPLSSSAYTQIFGSSMELVCLVSNLCVTEHSVTWSKNGDTLETPNNAWINEGWLRWDNISEVDTGNYCCSVEWNSEVFTSCILIHAQGDVRLLNYISTCKYVGSTYIHTHIHTYIHTYIHTHIHTYIHTYIPTYTHICTYIRTYIHT